MHTSIENEHNRIENEIKKDQKLIESCLIIDEISKSYSWPFVRQRQSKAVDSIKFTAKIGELVTILGENGAGKTTLINIITGNLQPTSGNAMIFGKDLLSNLEFVRASTSLCPQNDIYWEELTVFEHLELFIHLKEKTSQSEIETKITELLKAVELNEKRDERIKTLSGGMKRRLAIALSIIGNPKIIIFDEPTVGLDPLKRNRILKIIKVVLKEIKRT